MLQKEHLSNQKYHLTNMTPNINGISQELHLTAMAS